MQRGDTTLMQISGSKPINSFDKVGNITETGWNEHNSGIPK